MSRVIRRRLGFGAICFLVALGVLGVRSSPYYTVGPGPVVRIGGQAHGSWAVTTVRVRDGNWFQWAVARVRGERSVRRTGGEGDGGPSPAMARSMRVSQTRAALVASQLAAGRAPIGGGGLQVTRILGDAEAAGRTGLRPGDIVLGLDGRRGPVPLRTETDLEAAAAEDTDLRVLVAPRARGGTMGRVRVQRIPAGRLADVRADPAAVDAVTYSLGAVQGPSAGLMLTLARLDALTPGELTGGRHVAGTGGIGLDGAVTRVGEVTGKVRAAIAAHMDVFLVPAVQSAEAARAAQGSAIRIVPVRTASDAAAWLTATGATRN
ncbi:S16 family serine protease [Actinomadura sp. B10D3]|uniref:S16 family serine protease n=1 Tax=Actinomadura sp. B10D3 TaxID=3153557 RepID=UPI00325D5F16